jgi:hypothetical protein
VNFHSSLGHAKAARNHLVRLSQADMVKNVPLARCQLRRFRIHIMTELSARIIDLAIRVVPKSRLRDVGGSEIDAEQIAGNMTRH